MATQQANITEAVAQAVVDAARVAVQAMALDTAENNTRHEVTQNV